MQLNFFYIHFQHSVYNVVKLFPLKRKKNRKKISLQSEKWKEMQRWTFIKNKRLFGVAMNAPCIQKVLHVFELHRMEKYIGNLSFPRDARTMRREKKMERTIERNVTGKEKCPMKELFRSILYIKCWYCIKQHTQKKRNARRR